MTEETVRPDDLKPGDRVRVTLEGEIDGDGEFPIPGDTGRYLFAENLAHATITRLPPPADPDLILARKVVADRARADFPSYAREIERGDGDDGGEVQTALAAIKAAKEQCDVSST